MYPNFNYGNVPSGSGAGYPYMQQPLLPPPLLPMQAPIVPPMVPPGFNDEYAKWAQWNSHFGAIAPTSSWRNQAAAAMPRTPYDHPVTAQHQVPYGGRPYVPRDLSGPNANTMRAPPVPATINQQKVPEPFYNNVTPTLDFDVHVSSTKLDIHWKAPHVSGQIVYELTVTEARSMPFTLEFPANHTKHTMRAKAGESYLIAITARKTANNVVVAQGQRQIKAIFSDAELRTLYDKAVKYTGSRMHPFEILYRCKPKPYWDDIHHNCNNVMEKYMKDDNGQPANMINGVISGLFFSARLLPNLTLPYSSPFGNVRMLVPAVRMLDPNGVNIYFADFYCNKQAHYVTIIVAKKGSESDIYSQKYLLPLDMRSNPWLKFRLGLDGKGMSKLLFEAAHSVWVEVLFTENVPLSWGRFDKIQATGLGTSKIGGLSNNKSCTICNLYPPGSTRGGDDKERESLSERDSRESDREREARHRRDKERRRDRKESEKEEDGERRKKRRRSVSPAAHAAAAEEEEEENIEPPEFEPLASDDEDLDGVPLPAYEMGGNSTFQTLINLGNASPLAPPASTLWQPSTPRRSTTVPLALRAPTTPSMATAAIPLLPRPPRLAPPPLLDTVAPPNSRFLPCPPVPDPFLLHLLQRCREMEWTQTAGYDVLFPGEVVDEEEHLEAVESMTSTTMKEEAPSFFSRVRAAAAAVHDAAAAAAAAVLAVAALLAAQQKAAAIPPLPAFSCLPSLLLLPRPPIPTWLLLPDPPRLPILQLTEPLPPSLLPMQRVRAAVSAARRAARRPKQPLDAVQALRRWKKNENRKRDAAGKLRAAVARTLRRVLDAVVAAQPRPARYLLEIPDACSTQTSRQRAKQLRKEKIRAMKAAARDAVAAGPDAATTPEEAVAAAAAAVHREADVARTLARLLDAVVGVAPPPPPRGPRLAGPPKQLDPSKKRAAAPAAAEPRPKRSRRTGWDTLRTGVEAALGGVDAAWAAATMKKKPGPPTASAAPEEVEVAAVPEDVQETLAALIDAVTVEETVADTVAALVRRVEATERAAAAAAALAATRAHWIPPILPPHPTFPLSWTLDYPTYPYMYRYRRFPRKPFRFSKKDTVE